MQANVREKERLISVVVPVYNVKIDYLRCCIDSILQEPSEEIEIVIIDDNSSNGCEAICDEYEKTDDRVRVIHQSVNSGVSEARNIGIHESCGRWIVFVDSDDWLEGNYLSKITEHDAVNVDIIMFSAMKEYAGVSYPFGTSDSSVIYSGTKGEISLSELCSRMLKQCLLSTHPRYDTVKYCWGKAFRREFLEKNDIRFADLNYCEDIVFMSNVLCKACGVMQIPDRLYHYRVTENSAVNSFRTNALAEQRKFVNLMQESVEEDSLFYAALLSMQICITRYLYHKNNKKSLISKHMEAKKFFSQYPYCDVFEHINCNEMKQSEKIKALLIKHRQYYLYSKGAQIMKLKTSKYK